MIEPRARAASAASSKPCTSRAARYCSASRGRTAAGRRRRARSWRRRRPACAAGLGHRRVDAERRRCTPGTPPAPRRRRRSGPAARGPRRSGRRARAGWARGVERRRGRGRGRAARPLCGTEASPARAAIRNAGANSCRVAAALVVAQPEPDDLARPSPAYRAASRASVRASSGCRTRLAATMIATSQPVVRGRLAGGVEHDLDRGRQAADERRRTTSGRPASPASGSPRRRRPPRPRARCGACRPRRARTGRAAS